MNQNVILFFIGLILGGIIVSVFFIMTGELNNQTAQYYQDQGKTVCETSNLYRNMSLTLSPQLAPALPDALDCERIFQLEVIN